MSYKFAAMYFGVDDSKIDKIVVSPIDKIVVSPQLRWIFNLFANELCDLLQDGVEFDELEAVLMQKVANIFS